MGLYEGGKDRTKPTRKVRVVLVRDEEALDRHSRPNAEVIHRMLDQAVTTLLGESDPVEAWKLLVKPDDIVGIKSNVWAYLPTPKEVVQAIRRRLMDAGVSKKNIGVDDRGVLRNPSFRRCTALINARPLRTHFWSGIGGCIKNYIMFVPNPQDYHPDQCADLAAIWKLPHVRGKTRLNVLCVLRPLFYGRGPHHFNPRFVWDYKGLLVGTDPVALDAIGARLLQAKRIDYFGKDRPLDTTPKHIVIADVRHKLGVSNPQHIELVKIGWTEGILI